MSKNRSEAERLLSTIVSSRVRLSALRGEPAGSIKPTLDLNSDKVEKKTATDIVEDIDVFNDEAALFTDLPPEDEHTDIGPPPLILGLEDDDAELSHGPETTSPPKLPTADPFSFLDLIPPPAPPPTTARPEPTRENHTPPPVRTGPLMPLPTGAAAGPPSVSKTEPPPTPVSPHPMLAQPRAVSPRILDPDRARLEVDVYVDTPEDETTDLMDFVGKPPKLTETPAPRSRPTATQPPQSEEAVFDLVTLALLALGRGAIREAEQGLSDALDWDPTHIQARLARGRCLRDMGDIVGAMSDFLICQAQAPHAPDAHIEIGNLFFAKKDYGRAITHYSDALSIDPEHTMALCRRGISHHHRRRPVHALEDLSQARLIDPAIPNIDRYIHMVSSAGMHRG